MNNTFDQCFDVIHRSNYQQIVRIENNIRVNHNSLVNYQTYSDLFEPSIKMRSKNKKKIFKKCSFLADSVRF